MHHAKFWAAIDALAAANKLSPSGLARAAGLDPTTFNKSKRLTRDGKPRWPSTESLSRALAAVGANLDEFAAYVDGPARGPTIPIVALARAGANILFDEQGFPVGANETVRFPGLSQERVYAVEITGDSMEPVFRQGDIVIVQPSSPVRRGDRVVVKTTGQEVLAKELGRRTEQSLELISVNPAYPVRTLPTRDVEWIARIIWSSQ